MKAILIVAIITLFCLPLVGIAQQPSRQFPSVKAEGPKPGALTVGPDKLKAIQDKYQLQVESQFALKTAMRLKLDTAVIERFQKEFDLQSAELNVLILTAKFDLAAPKDALLDLQTGTFSVPQPTPAKP